MVGAMIVAAAAGVSAAGVAASFALTAAAFAVNFAVSIIVSRVFGQDQQGPQDSGTRQQVPPSSTNAIPIVYGDAYLGGTFVDAVITTDQKVMYYVMAVSSISPNGQFTFDTTDMYYGDRKITFDETDRAKVIRLTDEAKNPDDKINGSLYIGLYTSTQSGVITNVNWFAPHEVMASTFAGHSLAPEFVWPSTGRQMNGLAFAIVRLEYNQDAGTTNLSPITFKAKHTLFGTGVAKPGDVWADYISNFQYGGAVASSNVDVASAIALNNYSDQLITYTPSGGGSATQARYRMNGVLDAGQPVLSNLDKIMTCCDSWMAYNAALGQWSIVINKAETTSYAFDDDNIIGEVRVSATDIAQSINQVEAKFPDKGARDQPNFVNIATPSGLRYPNEPDNKYSVSYDLCNDSVQAQYLANRILEQAREDLIVSFSTTYYGIQVDAGSVVSVTNSDYGWSNKLFRVVKVNEASLPDGSLGAKLELSEYSAAVYDDYDITQYVPVPNSQIPSVSYFSALSAPVVTASNPLSSIPNFNVSIAVPATGRVTYCLLYYTTSATPSTNDWKLLATAQPIDGIQFEASSTYVFSNQILPTGASSSETYYFSYVVGSDLAKSERSPTSFPFTWSPAVLPSSKNATGYLYYSLSSATAPSAPIVSGYNFTTGLFSSISVNWSQTFAAPTPNTTSKFWACYYSVTETNTGAQTITVSNAFNWTNFDGLVTFTNLETNSGTTFIDGGNIKTNTISVTKLTAGLLIGYTFRTGSGNTPSGNAFEVNSVGTVWADNLIGGFSLFENFSNNSAAVTGFTNNNRNYPAIAGYASSGNTAAGAHGLRGQSFQTGAAGFVGGANNYDFYADGSGTNYGPFTGNHDILVPVGQTLTVGDLVVDVQCVAKKDWSNAVFEVAKSTQPNQAGCRGVFVGNLVPLSQVQPSVFIDSWVIVDDQPVAVMTDQYESIKDQYLFGSMSCLGEGLIQVTGEAGNINVDTLLVTSSTAGVAMAQSDDVIRSSTVAKARETIVFASPTEVKTVACIYLGG